MLGWRFPSPVDEPSSRADDMKQDIQQFLHFAQAHGGRIPSPKLTMASAPGSVVVVFEQVLAPAIAPAFGAAVGAWLQGRAGRKVRMKVGDIEIEASTPEELGQLLQQALAVKAELARSARSARDHE